MGFRVFTWLKDITKSVTRVTWPCKGRVFEMILDQLQSKLDQVGRKSYHPVY